MNIICQRAYFAAHFGDVLHHLLSYLLFSSTRLLIIITNNKLLLLQSSQTAQLQQAATQDSNDKPNKLSHRTAARSQARPVCKRISFYLPRRDGPNVRWWHSAEAEGLGRLTERVPNVRLNFGRMLCARMKQRLLLVSALSGQKMS